MISSRKRYYESLASIQNTSIQGCQYVLLSRTLNTSIESQENLMEREKATPVIIRVQSLSDSWVVCSNKWRSVVGGDIALICHIVLRELRPVTWFTRHYGVITSLTQCCQENYVRIHCQVYVILVTQSTLPPTLLKPCIFDNQSCPANIRRKSNYFFRRK